MNTYTLTLDNSPKAKLFLELLKDMAFVKAVEPFKITKSKKEKINFDTIDTTELLMKDKQLMKTIDDYKKNGRDNTWVSFTPEELDAYNQKLLGKTK